MPRLDSAGGAFCMIKLLQQTLKAALADRSANGFQNGIQTVFVQDRLHFCKHFVNGHIILFHDLRGMSQGGIEAHISEEAPLQHQYRVEGLQLQTWSTLLHSLRTNYRPKGFGFHLPYALYPTASPAPIPRFDCEAYFIGHQPPLSSITKQSFKSETLFSSSLHVLYQHTPGQWQAH